MLHCIVLKTCDTFATSFHSRKRCSPPCTKLHRQLCCHGLLAAATAGRSAIIVVFVFVLRVRIQLLPHWSVKVGNKASVVERQPFSPPPRLCPDGVAHVLDGIQIRKPRCVCVKPERQKRKDKFVLTPTTVTAPL